MVGDEADIGMAIDQRHAGIEFALAEHVYREAGSHGFS